MNYFGKIFTAAVTFVLCCTNIFAQEQNPADTAASSKPAFPENAPMMRQDGSQKLTEKASLPAILYRLK